MTPRLFRVLRWQLATAVRRGDHVAEVLLRLRIRRAMGTVGWR